MSEPKPIAVGDNVIFCVPTTDIRIQGIVVKTNELVNVSTVRYTDDVGCLVYSDIPNSELTQLEKWAESNGYTKKED